MYTQVVYIGRERAHVYTCVQHMQTCEFSYVCTCPNPPASALVEFEGHSRSANKNKHHHASPWQHSFMEFGNSRYLIEIIDR